MLVVRRYTVQWVGLLLSIALAGVAILPDTTSLNFLSGNSDDGFISQIFHIHFFYDWSDFEPMSQLNAHLVRWVLYYPIFNFRPHDYFFYVLYATPISFLLARKKMWLVILVLLVMPFFLSLRSGLAAIGLLSVYFVIFYRLNAGLVLTLGVLLCVFSSSTLVQATLFFFYIIYKRGLQLREFFPFLISLVFLIIAINDKAVGALAGAAGYVYAESNSNILVGYVMRSTIVVSLQHGNSRAYVYLGILVVTLVCLTRLLKNRGGIQGMRRGMMFCLLPAFALEGLGVIAAVPVIAWAIAPKYWRGL